MQIDQRNAIIAADLVVTGALRNGATIEVHGLVQGTIAADRVVIHPGGRVLGILQAGDAEINGLMQGNVSVRQLMSIGTTGVVRGDVRYGRIAMAAGGELTAELRNVPPEISGDFQIVVRRGRWITITTSDISAFDPDDAAGDLTFAVMRPTNGNLARSAAPRTPIEHFTQSELLTGAIFFAHDGSNGQQASFEIVVTDKAGASSGTPRAIQVTVI